MILPDHLSFLCRIQYDNLQHPACPSQMCDCNKCYLRFIQELPTQACECYCHEDENFFIDLGLEHIFSQDYVSELDRLLPYE